MYFEVLEKNCCVKEFYELAVCILIFHCRPKFLLAKVG